MRRKRIAVLAGQVDEATQTQFFAGFTSEAYKQDYDICVFSLYQKYQEDWLRELGDVNIFELVNYDLFDGVVIMLDTILTRNFSNTLQERVKAKFKGPVLVIDRESEYFDSIMMDHYNPVYKLVEHLIVEHGYKDIAFLGGKEGHPHSVQRYNAFLDCMRDYNLEVNESWVYHGNYWYDTAEIFADRLLRFRNNMPRAIACANDIMAIGVAARLTEKGIRIPEDIAIIGYDSVEDGRNAPQPLTSSPIPSRRCGEYAFKFINAKINGESIPEFEPSTELYIGESCGCKMEEKSANDLRRKQWKTNQSSRSMFSDFNHLLEDLMTQTSMRAFMEALQRYLYQIKPYTHFDVCLNEGFLNPENIIGEKSLRKGYSETIHRVLSSSNYFEGDEIDFERVFRKEDLIPDLFEERDYPTTYFFNPLFCDDRCFGYTVLNFGQDTRTYKKDFRVWMRSVMQGMEAFYRLQYLQQLVAEIKASQIRDSLTGLYNYDGFTKQIMSFIGKDKKNISIIAFDIMAFKSINTSFGRDTGDMVINGVARCVLDKTRENEICSRVSNDEFLIALEDNSEGDRTKALIAILKDDISNYRIPQGPSTNLEIHSASMIEPVDNERSLESLINRTIGLKNRKKMIRLQNNSDSNEELMNKVRNSQIVERILNENLLTYYYQPIVNAKDGSIFAYEALMRCEVEKINPLQIIEAAGYLNRLQDVETATLLNVTQDVIDRMNMFGDSKVFINSLPGHHLDENGEALLYERVMNNRNRFVIEMTEESELSDDDLNLLKKKNGLVGLETAIDDYGTGYSNIANLLRYVPRYVKVDRSLISQIHKNMQKQHFVKDIVSFAHDNGIYVLAEGVELQEELKMVIEFGVDLIQGYYTGRPQRDPVSNIDEDIINSIKRYRLTVDSEVVRTLY